MNLDPRQTAITIDHSNISEVKISVYFINAEFLFSNAPFSLLPGSNSTEVLKEFSFVKPSTTFTLSLNDSNGQQTVPLEDIFPDLTSSSSMVKVSGGGLEQALLHFGNSLRVRVMERLGVLEVASSEENVPMAGAYVKVFASRRDTHATEFHKDGYTDRRGRFDYATISSHGVNLINSFAVLVSTDTHGLVTVCTNPPPH